MHTMNTGFIFALLYMTGHRETHRKRKDAKKPKQDSELPDSYCPEAFRSISEAGHKRFPFQV